MNDFLTWLQMTWDWFWYQIGGWFGVIAFVGGTAGLSIAFAHLFKAIYNRRVRRHGGVVADYKKPR